MAKDQRHLGKAAVPHHPDAALVAVKALNRDFGHQKRAVQRGHGDPHFGLLAQKHLFGAVGAGDPDPALLVQANTAAFLSAAAETSSVKASESLERVHELVQEIPDTEGLKEAIDLNTRVTAELSIALANIWNMESAQLMGMGEAGVMDAATAAEEQKFIKVLGGE